MISKTDQSVTEVVETLTGFEEQHIEKSFGGQIEDLLAMKPTMGLRALAIVMVKRDLVEQDVKNPDTKAFKHVMDMTLKQVNDFFPDDYEPEKSGDTDGETAQLGESAVPAGEGVAAE